MSQEGLLSSDRVEDVCNENEQDLKHILVTEADRARHETAVKLSASTLASYAGRHAAEKENPTYPAEMERRRGVRGFLPAEQAPNRQEEDFERPFHQEPRYPDDLGPISEPRPEMGVVSVLGYTECDPTEYSDGTDVAKSAAKFRSVGGFPVAPC